MAKALVTGSNRGIGLELTRQLKLGGHDVIATCRTSSEELDQLGVRVESGLDVTSGEAVRDLANRIEGTSLDIVVLGAGVMTAEGLGSLSFDAIRQQLEVNALGPLRVVEALLPNLREGSKVAIITSRMGSLADNTSGGYYGYRMSKAAVNAVGVCLAHDLRGRGVAVVNLHPGYVRTRMTGGQGLVDPDESARNLLARIDDLTLETTGRFIHMNGEELPW